MLQKKQEVNELLTEGGKLKDVLDFIEESKRGSGFRRNSEDGGEIEGIKSIGGQVVGYSSTKKIESPKIPIKKRKRYYR